MSRKVATTSAGTLLYFCGRSTAGAGLVLNELNGSPRLSVARAGDASPRLCGRAYLRGCEAIVKIAWKLGWTYVFFEFHGCNERRCFFVCVDLLPFCFYILYPSTPNILPVLFAALSAPPSLTELVFCAATLTKSTDKLSTLKPPPVLVGGQRDRSTRDTEARSPGRSWGGYRTAGRTRERANPRKETRSSVGSQEG